MQNDAPKRGEAHPSGVWRATAITAMVAGSLWVPYAIPGYAELQVVGPYDDLPLVGLLSAIPRQGGRGIAGALRQPQVIDDEEILMGAAPLPAALELPPEPSRASAAPDPLPRVDPEEYAGLTEEIEDPQHSMRAFYHRLGEVERGRPRLARLAIYGTSINGADRTTSQLRSLLQERFGDGGKGWVPVAPGWRFLRHQDVSWTAQRWRTYVVNRGDGPLDHYGFGGVVAINRDRRARARLSTVGGDDGPGRAVSRFTVFYQAWPEGGSFDVSVDDGQTRRVSARAEAVEDRVEVVEVEDGEHALNIGATGHGREDLRLYGVTMERDGPGVVVDGLALIGAFTRVLRNFDEEHIQTQVRLRDPNLLIFWLGANDAVSRAVPFVRDEYIAHYREVLRRYREASPSMSCMVMSVLDKGEQVGGQIRTVPRVPSVVETQRAVARAEGCAFFDTYRALGGDGSMRRWYRSRPRLVGDDLGHLTASGSRVVGTLLYRALLEDFDDWIAEGEPPPQDEDAEDDEDDEDAEDSDLEAP